MEGENNSKKGIIEEIKRMMAETKENIAKKEQVNA